MSQLINHYGLPQQCAFVKVLADTNVYLFQYHSNIVQTFDPKNCIPPSNAYIYTLEWKYKFEITLLHLNLLPIAMKDGIIWKNRVFNEIN